MKLEKWLKDNDISVRDLSLSLEVDRSTIYKYIDGTRSPSLQVAIKIEEITDGRVTCSDLCLDS